MGSSVTRPPRQLLPVLCALPLFAGSAFGWGCDAHQMIALIARAHLTPEASAAVTKLLTENPIDPSLKRFCTNRSADPLADASTWADDMRPGDHKATWHQMDIPLPVVRDATTDIRKWCDPISTPDRVKDWPGCVINAIPWEWARLRDPKATPKQRADALRYVVHFLSDLHAPLHTTDNSDQGGNCTAMSLYDYKTNLHSMWDSGLVIDEMRLRGIDRQQYAVALDKRFANRWNDWGAGKIDFAEWAWEGHKVAASVIYGNLRPQIPVEDPRQPTDCDAERARVTALHMTVGDDYFNAVLPTLDEQLVKGAYRVAELLNQTFSAAPASPAKK